MKFSQKLFESLPVHTGYPAFFLKKNLL